MAQAAGLRRTPVVSGRSAFLCCSPRLRLSTCARSTAQQGQQAIATAPPDAPGNGVPQSKVEVRVYNIDRYGLVKLANAALKKNEEAIWHVGVAVYGYEFWFDHRINRENLDDVDYAFGFGPVHTYDLGSTTKTLAEFEDFVFGPMMEKYNIEKYDCFCNNCHHFANDLCLFLTNKGIPQWCLDHGEQGLSELDPQDAKKVRWASNKMARIMMVAWGRYNKERFIKRVVKQEV